MAVSVGIEVGTADASGRCSNKGTIGAAVVRTTCIKTIFGVVLALTSVAGTAEDGAATIGTEAAYPPFSFVDDAGRISGFNQALARATARVAGVEVDIVLRPWPELRSRLEAGGLDAIAGMYYSEERDRTFDFSQPFLVVSHTIFGPRGARRVREVAQLEGRRVAVMDGDIADDYLRETDIPGMTPVRAETQADALLRVAEGDADYAFVARLPGHFHLREQNLTEVEELSDSLLSVNYCFAVPEGNTELLPRLSEGLVILRETGEYQEILDEWLGVYEHPSASWGETMPYLMLIAGPLLLVALGALVWSRMLKVQVRRRTADLEAEIHNRERTELHLDHANRVLEAIRQINRAVADTQDADELARDACRIVASHGYDTAWIILVDEASKPLAYFQEGIATEFGKTLAASGSGLPPCCTAINADASGATQIDPDQICPSCPLYQTYILESALTARLEYGGRLFGYLTATAAALFTTDEEEQRLFATAAEEIAYGLHDRALSEERERLQHLLKDASIIVESSPMVLFRWRPEESWPIAYVSQNVRQFGYDPDDLMSGRVRYVDMVHPDDLPLVQREVAHHFQHTPGSFIQQYRIVGGDGSVRWVEDRTSMFVDSDGALSKIEGIVFDITEQRSARQHLEAALQQKETLLRELYHRTKNNMQVIASMVALRGMTVADDQARDILREIEGKIYAMALVHTKLYQSKDLSKLSLEEYLRDLAQLVLDSHSAVAEKVALRFTTSPVYCLIDTAVPLGLIAAELVTNSLKHAFPNGRKGTVELRLRESDTRSIILEILDDGVGFPEDTSPLHPESLGLQTVRHIVELQLGGSIDVRQGAGAGWTITIPPESYDRRV